MSSVIVVQSGESASLTLDLGAKIYEFNCAATGIADGQGLYAEVRDGEGALVAGMSGHTWGGTCEVLYLWVRESSRRQGIGAALLSAAEAEAARRGCSQVVLLTHSFQAPRWYEGHGYSRAGSVSEYPRGHAKYIYAKAIVPGPSG